MEILRPLRAWLTLCLGSLVGGLSVACPVRAADEPAAPNAVLIKLEGTITPFTEQFLNRRLEQAKSRGANLIILEIDSPGGLVDPSLDIAHTLRDLKWARTIAYIPRRALSGAAFAALGCDQIYMKPSASLGDAGPIIMGEDSLFRHAPEKIVSDLALQLRDLAEAKGRPMALAEAMVNRNLEVFEMRNEKTGATAYLSEVELDQLDDRDDWKKERLVFESRKDHFLEVKGKRAAELGLANDTVSSVDELYKKLKITDPPLVLEHTTADTIVLVLNNPFVTGLLLVIGLICLYVELHIPGFGIAGIASGLCFALFFWSRIFGGTAGWLEVILFLCGVVCLGIELFILPGFGVAGVSGVLLIVASIVLASQTFIIPQTNADLNSLGRSAAVITATIVVFVGSAMFLGRYFESMPIFRRLVLAPPGTVEPADEFVETEPLLGGSKQWLVNQEGVATTFLRPAGKATIGDELVDVVAEGSFIDPGRTVRVITVQGNRVVVREV